VICACLAVTSEAYPVSNKAAAATGVNPPVHTRGELASTSGPKPQSYRMKLLHDLHDGAGKLSTLLQSAAPLVGSAASPPLLFNKEYDRMTEWWCRDRQLSSSNLCSRRAYAARLKQLDGEAKKKALHSPEYRAFTAHTKDATRRKAMADEAKQMLESFCKTTEAASLQICVRTLGVLEMGKRLWRRQHNATSG
jgi:hypothetical protein